jgi:hypothetical protein
MASMDIGDFVYSQELQSPCIDDIYKVVEWETGFRRVYLHNVVTGQRVGTDPRCYKRWTRSELPGSREEIQAAEAVLAEKRRLRAEKKQQKLTPAIQS